MQNRQRSAWAAWQLIAVIVLICGWPRTSHGDQWITIGSWNIEFLGSRSFGQAPKALAEHIELSGVDVLALQEINDNDDTDATRTNTKLDAAFEALNESAHHDWDYVLFENKQSGDKSQLCGVAWNKLHVSKVGDPFKIPVVDDTSNDFFEWDRHPHAVQFSCGSGKFDFVIISVHMKSNVGAGDNVAQRALEAQTLVDQLPQIRTQFSDEDIVIIGDTNVLGGNEEAVQQFVTADFKDLNEADRTSFVSGSAPFDRIFVPNDQNEFRFASQYILLSADPNQHDTFLSDHHMILTAVKILDDDD